MNYTPAQIIAAALDPVEVALAALARKVADLPAPRDGHDGIGIDAPAWSLKFHAAGEVVSHFHGQVFRALVDTGEEPGDSEHWQRLGTAGYRWRGERTEGMKLTVGDLYAVPDGTVYQVDHKGASITLIRRGRDGDPGEPGKPGDKGADGIGADATIWEPRVYREGAVVTHFLGQFFRALVDTVEEPGDSAHWQRLGNGGLRWRGPVEEGDELHPGDLVPKDGALFQVDHTRQRRLVAARGEKGKRGDPGAPGKPGADGGALLDVTLGTSSLVFRLGLPGAEREVEVDLDELVERVAVALVTRHVYPVLEEIGRRLVDLERRP